MCFLSTFSNPSLCMCILPSIRFTVYLLYRITKVILKSIKVFVFKWNPEHNKLHRICIQVKGRLSRLPSFMIKSSHLKKVSENIFFSMQLFINSINKREKSLSLILPLKNPPKPQKTNPNDLVHPSQQWSKFCLFQKIFQSPKTVIVFTVITFSLYFGDSTEKLQTHKYTIKSGFQSLIILSRLILCLGLFVFF